jgi:hypothetical protein
MPLLFERTVLSSLEIPPAPAKLTLLIMADMSSILRIRQFGCLIQGKQPVEHTTQAALLKAHFY